MHQPIHLERFRENVPIQAPSDPDQGGRCRSRELCELAANTASKSSCIEWASLGPDARPTRNIRPVGSLKDPRDRLPDFVSTPLSQYESPFPCVGLNDGTTCRRSGEYGWPAGYAPPNTNGPASYQLRNITRYGDPVDAGAFYNRCGTLGVDQFRAVYEQTLLMNGFEMIGLPNRGDLWIRVLAKTAEQRLDR